MTSRPPDGGDFVEKASEKGGLLLEASPTYSNGEKVFVCDPDPINRRKGVLVWAFTAVLLVGAVATIIVFAYYHQKPTSEPTRDLAAINALVNFHRRLVDIDDQITTASKANEQSGSLATHQNDLLGLFDSANHYWAELADITKKLSALRTPELNSRAAYKWASGALALCRDRVKHLEFAQSLIIDSVDHGKFRPSDSDAFRAAIDKANIDAKNEKNEIRRSYEALGVSPERVDFGHGGLSN